MGSVFFVCKLLAFVLGTGAVLQDQQTQLVKLSNIYYIDPVPSSDHPVVKLTDLQGVEIKEGIKLLIHGYFADLDHVAMAPVRNGSVYVSFHNCRTVTGTLFAAYLSKGFKGLLMAADWRDTAKLLYPTSRYLIQRVGIRLAKILKAFMRKQGISPESVHIIGHSLGAHMAGVMGRYFNGTIGRVTGLDPAKPLFQGNCGDCLNAEAAKFVDVIHTDFPTFGDLTPRGHADFYPNDGSAPQPGCNLLDIITATSCSHYRAPLLFAESVRLPENFPSVKCSINEIQNLNGRTCLQTNADNAEIAMMGENVSKSTRGEYYLETSFVPPYGLGAFSKGYPVNSL